MRKGEPAAPLLDADTIAFVQRRVSMTVAAGDAQTIAAYVGSFVVEPQPLGFPAPFVHAARRRGASPRRRGISQPEASGSVFMAYPRKFG